MLSMFNDIQGVLIAAAIIYSAKELRRVANEIHSLNHRVSLLERMFERAGVQSINRRDDGAGGSASGSDRSQSGS